MSTKNNIIAISLIIPAYKQEKTILKDILRIKEVMDELKVSYEILIVVDGEEDHTFEEAMKIKSSKVRILGYQHNHGKGFAVRYGSLQAKGNIIGFIDAGMDIKPNGLRMLLEHFQWYNADIIVGSKLHPVSKVQYPFIRRVFSWGYRFMVKLLFDLSIKDTQVGMKFFKRKVILDILPRLLVKQYAFDIEMLAVAHHLGYTRIYEAPIELDFQGVSSITSKGFWKVILHMLWDTCSVYYRLKILHYYDNANKNKWRYDSELNFRVNLP